MGTQIISVGNIKIAYKSAANMVAQSSGGGYIKPDTFDFVASGVTVGDRLPKSAALQMPISQAVSMAAIAAYAAQELALLP